MEVAAVTEIVQGGSFALLTFIALWALYWIPKWWHRWNEIQEDERESRVATAKAFHDSTALLTASFSDAIDKWKGMEAESRERLMKMHREDIRYEREQCARQYIAIMESLREQSALLREQRQFLQHHLGAQRPPEPENGE